MTLQIRFVATKLRQQAPRKIRLRYARATFRFGTRAAGPRGLYDDSADRRAVQTVERIRSRGIRRFSLRPVNRDHCERFGLPSTARGKAKAARQYVEVCACALPSALA